MSDNIKMADVFKLPLKPRQAFKQYRPLADDSNGGRPPLISQTNSQIHAACHAINSHDTLTAELTASRAEIERLREALQGMLDASERCTTAEIIAGNVARKALSGKGE